MFLFFHISTMGILSLQLDWMFPPPNLVLAHLNNARGRYNLIHTQGINLGTFCGNRNTLGSIVDTTTGLPPEMNQLKPLAWLIGGGDKPSLDGQNQRDNNY